MAIEDFLKNEENQARVSVGNNWLYWDSLNEQWIVLTRRYAQKNNTCLYAGEDLDKALESLLIL